MAELANHPVLGFPVEPGRLTPAHKERIEALSEEGWSVWRIARFLRKHPSTAQWHLYRTGIRAPRSKAATVAYVRNGRPVRHFSIEEDAFIQDLRVRGESVRGIAAAASERFGHPRQVGAIRYRLIMLGAQEDAA